MIKAIETKHKGYRFRSRLEARWAVFFDALELEWEYEKEGYETTNGKYLPDFYFPTLDCFAEVKPKEFTVTEYKKCLELPRPCIMLDKPHPTACLYYVANASEEMGARYKQETNYGEGWGLVVLNMSQRKKRLWFCFGEGFDEYYIYEAEAEEAAKSARFEYGEAP